MAAEKTASPLLGLSSLQNTTESNERELDTPTAGGSSKAGGDKPPGNEDTTKPFSSTTASGSVSKEGSHTKQGYLKMSRQERRKIEHDIKRKHRPGLFV